MSAATATSASASGMPTTSTTATGVSATTTATAAPTCGHRIDRASKGHHRRQEDRTYSDSIVCHDYLPEQIFDTQFN
jgi:hypothetical protein